MYVYRHFSSLVVVKIVVEQIREITCNAKLNEVQVKPKHSLLLHWGGHGTFTGGKAGLEKGMNTSKEFVCLAQSAEETLKLTEFSLTEYTSPLKEQTLACRISTSKYILCIIYVLFIKKA